MEKALALLLTMVSKASLGDPSEPNLNRNIMGQCPRTGHISSEETLTVAAQGLKAITAGVEECLPQ